MIKISLFESLIIGIITIFCGLFIEKIVNIFGSDEIKETNFFYRYKKSILFYVLLFIIGISIHIFIKYAQINDWYCKKVCDKENCQIMCTLPINGFTQLLITK